MGRFNARSFDRNRFTKKYPFVRAPRRPTFVGDQNIIMEMGTLEFSNEDEKIFKFEIPFNDDQYNIMLVARDTGSGESAHVNLYVDNTRSNNRQITVVSTARFTGKVDVVAIRVG